MSREHRILGRIIEQASLSTQRFKHGAVFTGPGGKEMCYGYNKGGRTKILNKILTCTHSEMDVLNTLINCYLFPKYGKHYKDYTKKYILWVGRIENTQCSNNIKTTYSKPCFYCSSLLLYHGIKKVNYTGYDGEIIYSKTKDLKSMHKSHCQLLSETINNNIKCRV